MREKITRTLLDDLGKGQIHILIHNADDDLKDYLFRTLIHQIQERFPGCLIYPFFRVQQKNDIVPILESLSKLTCDRIIIILEDLLSFDVPESVINMFYGNNNIDLIAASTINPNHFFNDFQKSLIAGRYKTYFCPPMLFEDAIKEKGSSYHLGGLSELKAKSFEKAKAVYTFLLNNAGNVISFSYIKNHLGFDINLVTLIEIINYMNARGMIYLLNRMDVDKKQLLNNKFVVYPTFINDLDLSAFDDETKYYLKLESGVVAKIFNENDLAYYGVSFHFKSLDIGRAKITYHNGFFVTDKNGQTKFIIKTQFRTEYKSEYNKTSLLTPIIIASLGKQDLIMADDGVQYCGIETFLDEEFDYGRLS